MSPVFFLFGCFLDVLFIPSVLKCYNDGSVCGSFFFYIAGHSIDYQSENLYLSLMDK